MNKIILCIVLCFMCCSCSARSTTPPENNLSTEMRNRQAKSSLQSPHYPDMLKYPADSAFIYIIKEINNQARK